MIEKAYKEAEARGLAVWCHDQAGPFQTKPYPGTSWRPQGEPVRQPHEYIRNGTAKLMTLLHPASGQVRAKGVTSGPNSVLHPWLKQELSVILANLPEPMPGVDPAILHNLWAEWYEGLSTPPTLPDDLPTLRMLLIHDNLAGHKLIVLRTNHTISYSGVSARVLLSCIPLWAALGYIWPNPFRVSLRAEP